MNALLAWLTLLGDSDFRLVVAILTAKVTILLAAAWLMHTLLAKNNPRWRVVLWRSSGLGIVLLIGLAPWSPVINLAVLPADITNDSRVAAPVDTPVSLANSPSTRTGWSRIDARAIDESPVAR